MLCEKCPELNKQIEQLTKEKEQLTKEKENEEEKVKLLTMENTQLKEKELKDIHENELQNIAKDVKEVKEFIQKINEKMENSKDNRKEPETDASKENIIIVKDIVKDIQKSSHIIQNDVETICRDLAVKSKVSSKDSVAPTEDSVSEENKDSSKVVEVYTETTEVKLNYQKAPDSSKIVFAGDRNLDVIQRSMVDYSYNLLSRAKFNTSRFAKFKEFIIGESKGIKLAQLTSELEYLVLSFGRDDLVNHPDWLNEDEVSVVMDVESILKNNLNVAGRVAETCVINLGKISAAFKDSNVIYVLPPPSDLNEYTKQIFKEFREKIASMENKPVNLQLVDMKDVWDNVDNSAKEKEEGVGVVSFKGSRLLVQQLFLLINPTFKEEFCDQCYGMHQYVCPTLKMEPLPNDSGSCHLCAKKGHKARACILWEVLKQVRSCPHCGSFADGKQPGYVTHNPDLCKSRYEWCDVCDTRGHTSKIHQSPNATRAVLARIGDNLKVFDKSFLSKTDRNGSQVNKSPNKRAGSSTRNEDQPLMKRR